LFGARAKSWHPALSLFGMTSALLFSLTLLLAAPLFASATALPDFDKLWDYNDPAGTQKKFEALLEPAAAAGDDEYYYCLQTQIARCMGLQNEFPKAHKALDRVEGFLDRKEIPLVRVRYLLERGRVYNSAGSTQSARGLFTDAFDKAVEGEFWMFAVDAAHMVAIAESTPTGQIEWNLKALKLTDEHPETAKWKPSLWNNLGEAYRSKREFEKSLECFQSIIKYRNENNQAVRFYERVDVAKLLRLCGRNDESMKTIRALYDEQSAAGAVEGIVHEEFAENLLRINDEAGAKEQFVKAWEKLKDEQWIKDTDPPRYERLRQFGS
jgi:tetratricopeptide (TPR) repeat protein